MLDWNATSSDDKLRYRPETVFTAGLRNHQVANTAYPIRHSLTMRPYRVSRAKAERIFMAGWESVDRLGLYVHIPFCESRCSFCEYVVVDPPLMDTVQGYVDLLKMEFSCYRERGLCRSAALTGFDIGGGTPAMLSARLISVIVNEALRTFRLADGVSISIETTPLIAALYPKRIRGFRSAGIDRISMGIQTTSPRLLNDLCRSSNPVTLNCSAAENIRGAGFRKFNIDLMYGLAGMMPAEWETTLKHVIALAPDYITLYRTRYKGTRLQHRAMEVSLPDVNRQYHTAGRMLHDAGYISPLGKNTFSRIAGDGGVSDYLTRRVRDGLPYLGLGLGAQSWTIKTLAYNSGAVSKNIRQYKNDLENNRLPLQDVYHLSPATAMGKMVSVSFYFGGINDAAFKSAFGQTITSAFPEAIVFLLAAGLVRREGPDLRITSKGMDNFGGVIAQFYAPSVQRYIIETPCAIAVKSGRAA